jgi:hypothetical protein
MKRLITSLSLLITVFSINFDYKAAIISAVVNNGAWNSPASWSSGLAPQCGDTIEIPVGFIINVTDHVDLDDPANPLCGLLRINIAGSLRFSNGKKINLASGSCLNIEDGGRILPSKSGGGASERISIDGVEWWRAGDGALNGPSQMGCIVPLPISNANLYFIENEGKLLIKWELSSLDNILALSIENSNDGVFFLEIYKNENLFAHSNDFSCEFDLSRFSKYSSNHFKLFAYDIQGFKREIASILYEFKTEDLLNKLHIYPNPAIANSEIHLNTNEKFSNIIYVDIINAQGALIQKFEFNNLFQQNKFSLQPSNLEKGSYFIHLTDEQIILTSRFNVM